MVMHTHVMAYVCGYTNYLFNGGGKEVLKAQIILSRYYQFVVFLTLLKSLKYSHEEKLQSVFIIVSFYFSYKFH